MAGSVLVNSLQTNLTGYSVQEDATSLDPSATTGGVGQLDFDAEFVDGPEGSIQLAGLDVELRDNYRGSTFGTISDVGMSDDGTVSLTANGRLGALVGNVAAVPMVDTLQNVMLYYFGLAGITDGIAIDPDIAFQPVAVPGFNDDLWLHTKQLAAVHGCEITLVNNNVVVRPVRSFEADTSKRTSLLWHVEKADAAQYVEVTYYGNSWVGDDVVYPFTDKERTEAQSFQVEENGVLEDDLTLSVSLATVDQPVAVDEAPQDYGKTSADDSKPVNLGSIYTIYDTNNVPVTAQTWRDNGGKIELKINDDTTSLHIKITGPTGIGTGPYRIVGRTEPTSVHSEVESKTETDYGDKNTKKDNKTTTTVTGINAVVSDDAEDYPALFIVGRGVAIDPQVIRIPTGMAAASTVNEIGTTVEVPAVSTIDDAYRVAVLVAGQWTGAQLTLTGTVTSVNQVSGSGEVKFRTLDQFNADYPNLTLDQFNAVQGNRTFKDFNDAEYAKVKDEFDNQTFGNVAGARLKYGDTIYRIDSTTITDEDISFNASADTTFDDFNAALGDLTFSAFNSRFTGKSFSQFNRIPLNKAESTGTIYVPPVPTDAFPDTFYPDDLYPADDPYVNPGLVARVGVGRVDVNTVG
jgi:hypothetical protein